MWSPGSSHQIEWARNAGTAQLVAPKKEDLVCLQASKRAWVCGCVCVCVRVNEDPDRKEADRTGQDETRRIETKRSGTRQDRIGQVGQVGQDRMG